MPLQTLYRACFFYYDSLDWKKKDKLNIFCSTTTSSKEEAKKYLDDNVFRMYAKLLTKFIGKAFTIKNLGDCYYLIESNNIVGFIALGDITPVYKIHPGYYKYRHFSVYKYSDKFIVKDFIGNLLDIIWFTTDTKDQAFNEAFDLVDKYANDPKYLRDHDFNGFMKRKKDLYMNKNKFIQLFEKYNWIVEEYGDNNFIAYNDIYFVPFSCVPFAYEDATIISCVSYAISDKKNFIDQWRYYNQDVENTNFECKIGDFAFKMYSVNSKHIKKLSHIGGLANRDHSISEVEHWLDSLVIPQKYIANDSITKYNVDVYGCVIAIRIYLVDGRIPMADLVFPDGRYTTIEWANISHRDKYKSGINGYTLIYDERPKKDFKEWIL